MTDPGTASPTEQKRLYLRASIKILVTIGFVFLLVPLFKGIPWPKDEIPVDSILLSHEELPAGATKQITLAGNTVVFVTRNSPVLREQLQTFSAANLWFISAPGLAEQPYFVVRATSMQDEILQFLPAHKSWPGGFVATSGAAWDVAGRALKPWPGHPSGYVMNIQNLLPMPFRARDDGVLLIPPPEAPVPRQEENE